MNQFSKKMTHNLDSYICTYINDHPETWQEDIKKMNIRMSSEEEPDGHRYMIFNYFNGCDFSNPVVQEARGIIVDLTTLQVVCWPFRKFGNYGESYIDQIDWDTARVQDKKDGSICKLWFDPLKKEWRWSTNATIDARNANLEYQNGDIRTYMDAIAHADNYAELVRAINSGKLDIENTYIFELVGPYNRVVIHYQKDDLWHIGTRNRQTGQETKADIGIHHPEEYPIRSIDDCVQAAIKLNPSDDNIIREGFVVVDKDWHRIKVKSPAYVTIHRAVGNKINKQGAVEFLLASGSFDDVKTLENKMVIKYYDYQMAKLELEVQRYIDYVRGLADELNHDRKAIASVIKNDKFANYGFQCLRSDEITAADLLFHFKSSHEKKHLLDLIPDYLEG